jgi:hypothetical protein
MVDGQFLTARSAQNSFRTGFPGGVLALSANGSAPGTGILWATRATTGVPGGPGVLHAFDASDISKELWNSEKEPARDRLGNFAKFNTPTVANGKVYVGTFSNQLVVYGLFNDGVNVSMNPAEAALRSSQIQQFTASVTGASNTVVTWTVDPPGGTIVPVQLEMEKSVPPLR